VTVLETPDVAGGSAGESPSRTRPTAGLRIDNRTPALRAFWHPVATVGEVGPAPLAVQLLGEWYVVVRLGGVLRAFPDKCSHRDMPLSAGRVVGAELECPYHGYRFDGSGACTAIPARPATAAIPAGASLTPVWGVEERYGLVWLAVEEPLVGIPEVPEWEEGGAAQVSVGPHRWKAGAALITDNFLDVGHFPFVHAGTFGAIDDPAESVVPDITLERDGLSFSYRYEHLVRNSSEIKELHEADEEFQRREMSFELAPPFTVTARIHYVGSGLTDSLFFTCQPEDDGVTRLYAWLFGPDVARDPVLAQEYEDKVVLEDQVLLERFRDYSMPLDLAAQFHTTADRMTVEYRRVLADIVLGAAS
jgi:phenylpropionate dioxygenase-like ring-hydroxylating dioxygenase large terminal subunit